MIENITFDFPKATRYRRFDSLGLMIDFETLGTSMNCALLEFGAILFNLPECNVNPLTGVVEPYTIDVPRDLTNEVFHFTFDMRSQVAIDKRVIEPDSLAWWVKNPAFRDMLHRSMDRDLARAIPAFLQQLHRYYSYYSRQQHPLTIYAKGTNFDVSILEALCRNNNMEPFWKYNAVIDVRTFCKVAGIKALVAPEESTHDSLTDCLYQIESVRRAEYLMRAGNQHGFLDRAALDSALLNARKQMEAIRDARITRDLDFVLTFGRDETTG